MNEELKHACISERGGAELAHRVNFRSPVSISHIETSLFPWTAEKHRGLLLVSNAIDKKKERSTVGVKKAIFLFFLFLFVVRVYDQKLKSF